MPFLLDSPGAVARARRDAAADPEAFWADIARHYAWMSPWDTVCDWEFETPRVRWFDGAELNITVNCLDRHVAAGHGDRTAILWEPNDPADPAVSITYAELLDRVCRFANVLKARGVKKGDRVALYLPMVPELAVAVLACARIGAVHSVVFAGFSARSLADRIQDAGAVCVITSDGMKRGAKGLGLKAVVDQALAECPTVTTNLVVRHTGESVDWTEDRDVWLHDALPSVTADCRPERMAAEDLLFILYTSGSTGKPKGVVHTCGGYMVYAGYSFANVFQYQPGDIYWCTADIGWITGHSYIVYGPMLNGATTVMFEGVPTWPSPARFWEVCEKLKVNQFYTAPTAIRALMACEPRFAEGHDLSSLKIIGSVGEPINEEAWQWYHDVIGDGRCALVDTWWQTETGGILISGLGAHSPMKPAHAGLPLPGIEPVLVDGDGHTLEGEAEGYLCIARPWPSMIRTTYGDHERCRNVYFSAFKGKYFTGDGARRDADGMFRIIGRVDDVVNVSGHRFGTAEIEDAIDSHPAVAESAVIGYPHPIKGQAVHAYVILKEGTLPDKAEGIAALRKEIGIQVNTEIGNIARPDRIQFTPGLPKTRSGKIMRRILRKVACGEQDQLGDTSTLLDPTVVDGLVAGAAEFLG